jgi:hypothetical protein
MSDPTHEPQYWEGVSKKEYTEVYKRFEEAFSPVFSLLGWNDYSTRKKYFEALAQDYFIESGDHVKDLSVEDFVYMTRYVLSGETPYAVNDEHWCHDQASRIISFHVATELDELSLNKLNDELKAQLMTDKKIKRNRSRQQVLDSALQVLGMTKLVTLK